MPPPHPQRYPLPTLFVSSIVFFMLFALFSTEYMSNRIISCLARVTPCTVSRLGLSFSSVRSLYKSWSNTRENPLTHTPGHKSLVGSFRPCRPTFSIQRPSPSVSNTSLFCLFLKNNSILNEERDCCIFCCFFVWNTIAVNAAQQINSEETKTNASLEL